MERKHCSLRSVGYDMNGVCYATDKNCKDVSDEVCEGARNAYEFAILDTIRTHHQFTTEALENWKEFMDKHQRTDCPEKDGKRILCKDCNLCGVLDR